MIIIRGKPILSDKYYVLCLAQLTLVIFEVKFVILLLQKATILLNTLVLILFIYVLIK